MDLIKGNIPYSCAQSSEVKPPSQGRHVLVLLCWCSLLADQAQDNHAHFPLMWAQLLCQPPIVTSTASRVLI